MTEDHSMPIAVVGMGCRLPGGANSPEKLWDNLAHKRSARSEVPPSRFNIDAFHHPDGSRKGSHNNRGGYFLDQDVAAFDAPFFSISRAEAISMDPMQRILLEVAYEAAENAGIPIERVAGSDAGCFVGCFTQDYDEMAKRDGETLPKYHTVGTGKSILANRISFCFDLKGPSMTLDTACSSSLVALHLACQSLKAGECASALVGATNLILSPDFMVGLTNLSMLSPDSVSHAFDSRANGYARGEGVAALLLKPLSDALRDGDTIRSVIRGTAVNSNGRMPGITLPSKEAHISLMRAAYAQAGLGNELAATGYVEAHGTGTAAGDPVESGAIGAVLGNAEGRHEKLYIGSIKPNVGHLEGASGLAGVIKAILSIEAGVILPNIWFEKGNPNIDFDKLNVQVPTELVEWPVAGVRRASVNGFGYGGTNGHVIMDDAYHYLSSRGLHGNHNTRITNSETVSHDTGHRDVDSGQPHDRLWMFPLSASDPAALTNSASVLAQYVESTDQAGEKDESFLEKLSFTLNNRRSKLEYRHGIVAGTKEELIKKLEAQITPSRLIKGAPKIAFIFTGQGAQWWGMGRELVSHPVFKKTLGLCNESLRALGCPWNLIDELTKDEAESQVNRAPISQPLCTALQIALVDLLASWDVHPWRVAGHSSGEIAAAYAMGALSLDTSMKVAYYRGMLAPKIRTMGYKGGMLAVGLSEEETRGEIAALSGQMGQATVACVNSPKSITVSGDVAALTELQMALTARGTFARKLLVDTAYHSHHMLAIAEEYRTLLGTIQQAPADEYTAEMFSSVKGRSMLPGELLDADYWVANMVSPVRFSEATSALCSKKDDGHEDVSDEQLLLVELGPHSALAGPIKQILAALPSPATIQYRSAIVRGKSASRTVHELAAMLFEHGHRIDMYPASRQGFLSDLPPYSWNHSRTYWSESRISRDYRLRKAPRSDLLGAPASDWNPLEPRWRGFIRLSEQPWVAHHVVQGAILYPAAGFCCMAFQAASQIAANRAGGPPREYRIREMSISRALVVPQDDDGVEVIFSLRPAPMSSTGSSDTWDEFRIFSYTDAGGWAEHCRGLVGVGDDPVVVDLVEGPMTVAQETQRTCEESMDVGQLYEGLDAIGLSYGPDFRAIKSLIAGSSNHVMGTIEVTDTKSGMPKEHEFARLVHPTTLDAMLQLAIAAMCQGNAQNLDQAYVPTFIEEIAVSSNIDASAGRRFSAAAKTQAHGLRDIVASVALLGQDTFTPVIRMEGAKCRAISGDAASTFRNAAYQHVGKILWEPDVNLLMPEQLNTVMRKPLAAAPQTTRIRDLEFLAYAFMRAALQEVTVAEKSDMQSHHVQFYEYMQTQIELVQAHQHEQQTAEWTRLEDPDVQDRLARLKASLSSENDYEGRMILRMGHALPRVLRQEIDPLTLMMEDGLLHDYYTVSQGVTQTYPQVAEYIKLLSHKDPNLEYLEVGAGTGGLTRPVLDVLGGSGSGTHTYPRLKSYTYTDISAGFFDKAEAWLRPTWGRLIDFKKLNIEEDPAPQGFGQVDVVLAANVLHATKDINRTLENTRKLLKPGGKIVILDMAHKLMSVSVILGNLSGWWLPSEDWRKQSPLLSEEQWRRVLADNGFSDLQASTPDFLNPLEECTRVLVATAVKPPAVVADHHRGASNGERNGVSNGNNNGIGRNVGSIHDQQQVAILRSRALSAAENAVAQALEATLTGMGVDIRMISIDNLQQELMGNMPVISLMELEEAWLQDISAEDFTRLKQLTQMSGGIIWVTRGALSTRPELSLFQGLTRSLRTEDESRRYLSLDFSDTPMADSTTAAMITNLYTQSFVEKHQAGDSEFVEKDGMLWTKRLVHDVKKNQRMAERTRKIAPAPELRDIEEQREQQSLRLQAKTIGNIDSLVFVDDPIRQQVLSPGQVEIEVRAVGLNSHDVLVTLGEVADNYLGNECSGVITRAHKDVTNVAVGDRVAAWCLGSFATRVHCPSACVQRIPDEMSFPVAASLPLAYVTAYRSLVKVARLRPGESVLIHAGAGGVGQAAIQVSQMCGAEVYATTVSPEQIEFLTTTYGLRKDRVFHGSDLTFVREILRATNGRGIDVVLNSLAGDALRATWDQVLAPFGRFVELGKGDIDVNGKLGMSPFAKNTMFAAVDVTHLWREQPVLAGETFVEVMSRFGDNTFEPVKPVLVKPFSEVREAFKLTQSGNHTGKIVLEFRNNDPCLVVPSPLSPVSFPSDATYLLVGGLGGLGRSMSRWMVQRGARNFIYVSRGGASSAAAKQLLAELHQANVHAVILQCDVTDASKLCNALKGVLQSLPPLRGVIQGAMVLNDITFDNMTHNAFASTLRPKVQGSWSLHRATAELNAPLDFFVMLSSAAAFVGNAGQANYVAGCNYQVALAKYRRSQLGLPATAIDIGKVAEVGVVAESSGTVTEANLTRQGFADISEVELLSILELAIAGRDEDPHMVTGVTDIAKPTSDAYETEKPFWARDPVFSHLSYARPQSLQEDNSDVVGNNGSNKAGPSITQVLAGLDGTGKEELVAQQLLAVLAQRLARALMIPAGEVDTVKSPADMGADSLVAIEIRNWLAREAGIEVPVFDLLQAPSIAALAGNILKLAQAKAAVVKNGTR